MPGCIFFDTRVFHLQRTKLPEDSLFLGTNWRRNRNMVTEGSVVHVPLLCFRPGREATIFYSHLADLHSKRHGIPYTKTLCLMQCSILFSLLRSAILTIWGSRIVRAMECPTTSAELRLDEVQQVMTINLQLDTENCGIFAVQEVTRNVTYQSCGDALQS